MLEIVNLANGNKIGNQIQQAFNFWTRFKGLLGRRCLLECEGLLLHPCSSIHCFGMRFAIDAVFMDHEYRVLTVRENMKPGALAACKGAVYVLELAAGQVWAKSIQKGNQLAISKAPEK